MNDAVAGRHSVNPMVADQRLSLGRVLGVAVLVLASVAAMVWSARRPILTVAGKVLIAEDPVAPVDMIMVSTSDLRAAALEAASLYRRGMAGSVIPPTIRDYPIDDYIRRLGVPYPSATALAATILEYSGVPKSAIGIVPGAVDGTDTEVASVIAFVRQHMPRSVLFLTARSHTARAGLVLTQGYIVAQIYAAWHLYLHIVAPAGRTVDVLAPVYDGRYELVERSQALLLATTTRLCLDNETK